MKTLLTILLLSCFLSCEEDVDGTKNLSAEERAYLQERATIQCNAKAKPYFDELKKISNDRFYLPTAYANDTMYKHSFKVGADTSERYTHKVSIWKSTPTDVYLLLNIDDSTDAIQFLKIPKTTNVQMFDALQAKHCANDKNFVVSLGASTYTMITKSSTKEITQTFTVSAELLAFLSRYKESRKEQALDSAQVATGSPVSMSGSLATPVLEARAVEFQTYQDYKNRNLNPTLCLVDTDVYPYQTKCDASGQTTFPATEL